MNGKGRNSRQTMREREEETKKKVKKGVQRVRTKTLKKRMM
jgi:hypothetical protein